MKKNQKKKRMIKKKNQKKKRNPRWNNQLKKKPRNYFLILNNYQNERRVTFKMSSKL